MNNQSIHPKLIDELLLFLFEGQTHPLAESMASWFADSRRFTAFVNTFRDKIRKKLRTLQDQQRIQDLQLELETAYLLLRERSLSVNYEPQLGGVRSPDFAVSFTTSLTFMVEVTRMRTAKKQTSPLPASDRLAETLCEKLGQLLPQQSNVLLIGVDGPRPTQDEIHSSFIRLQQRAERNDPIVVQQNGFRGRTDFFRQYQRLSEILVRSSQLLADEPVVTWINPQAKYPLPAKVRNALHRSHAI